MNYTFKKIRLGPFFLSLLSRSLEDYNRVVYFGVLKDITKLTGCLKPCKYRKYAFLGHKYQTAFRCYSNCRKQI